MRVILSVAAIMLTCSHAYALDYHATSDGMGGYYITPMIPLSPEAEKQLYQYTLKYYREHPISPTIEVPEQLMKELENSNSNRTPAQIARGCAVCKD